MFVWDVLYVENFLLTLLISCIGFYRYKKTKSKLFLFLAIGFLGLVISHLMNLTVYTRGLEVQLIYRPIVYLIIAYGMTR